MDRRVAVIGGGYAGMAAAVTLAQHGIPVTVFEAARQLGGRARAVDIRDVIADNGQHILIGAYRETLKLIELVHERPPYQRRPLELVVPGEFSLRTARLPRPFHLAMGLLRANGLTVRDKLAAISFLQGVKRRRFQLATDVSAKELLEQYAQGERLTRYLWEPLCVAALNTPVASASAQVFLNVLRDSLEAERRASDLILPSTDLGQLFPVPAAAYVRSRGGEVLTSTSVTNMACDAQGYQVQTGDTIRSFRQVICAVPPFRLAALTGALPELEPARAMTEQFAYQPIYTIYLQYPASISLPYPMLALPPGSTGQWVFDRGRIDGTSGLLAVVISAEGAHQDMDHRLLAQVVDGELRVRFPYLPPFLWQRVIAEKRATFACTPGLKRPSQRTGAHGLYLAGDYTESDYPGTLEAAVQSGVKCANFVLDEP
jgi:squalene-associated FAD-dependent desaturase